MADLSAATPRPLPPWARLPPWGRGSAPASAPPRERWRLGIVRGYSHQFDEGSITAVTGDVLTFNRAAAMALTRAQHAAGRWVRFRSVITPQGRTVVLQVEVPHRAGPAPGEGSAAYRDRLMELL